MFRFPFTNFHELNLDWILSVVKEAKAVFDNGREDIDYAVTTADEAKEIAQQAAEATIPDNSVTTPKIRDYAVTSDKIATYAVTSDKIQEGGVIASKIANGLLYRPNLLDNWYFVKGSGTAGAYGVFPVNQRGQTVYNTAGFTIDRLYKANGKGTVYSTAQGLQFSNSDSDYATLLFNGQDVPAGVPAIYTVLTNLGITTVKTGGNNVTLPSGIIVYIDSSSRRLALRVPGNLSQNNSETFIAAKVELGSNQTLAHQENGVWVLNEIPDYGEQLAKCQSYLFTPVEPNAVYQVYGIGPASSDSNAAITITLPKPMAKIVSLETNIDTSKLKLNNTIPITNIEISNISGVIAKANVTCASGALTPGNCYFLGNAGNTNPTFLISAE